MKTDKEINADTTQESQADLRANPTAVSQAIESNETKPDVLYIPDFLTQAEADELLARIGTAADFRQNYIQIYGRKAIPRLEAWYSPWDYPYSKGVVLEAAPIPDYLQRVIDKMKDAGFGEFNAVLINRYRDGNDYISPHSDDDYGDARPTIPSLTLGAARPFRLAKWIVKGKKLDKSTTVEYTPGHGDLIVMRGDTNVKWGHWVPKTAKKIGERINLTFRYGVARSVKDTNK
ncbi:MAG: alpha-ketoglutarate-dependent dioxygenase AlkB [Terriglobales bacterium]